MQGVLSTGSTSQNASFTADKLFHASLRVRFGAVFQALQKALLKDQQLLHYAGLQGSSVIPDPDPDSRLGRAENHTLIWMGQYMEKA